MTYQPIENFGVIGDLYTVALVSMDGSIDFMCWPEFDSPSIFARLLDETKGGYFRLAPVFEEVHHKQIYLTDTNILLSRFLSKDGVAEVSDFMPVEPIGSAHTLIRRAKTARGEVRFRMTCGPAFDYARARRRVEKRAEGVLFIPESGRQPALRLRTAFPVSVQDGAAVSEFTLGSGETGSFVLEAAGESDDSPSSSPSYIAETFKKTANY